MRESSPGGRTRKRIRGVEDSAGRWAARLTRLGALVLAALSVSVTGLTPSAADAAAGFYVTNLNEGTVSQYAVGVDGALAPLSPPTVPAGTHPVHIAISPDGKSAYVANLVSDNVSQYDVGPGGALSPKSPATVPAGTEPLGIAISPDGKSVYVTDAGINSVSQYDVGSGGLLTPKSPPTAPAGSHPTFVAISPDGKSVYVANGAENDVSQYDVGSGGALAPKLARHRSRRRIPGRDGHQPRWQEPLRRQLHQQRRLPVRRRLRRCARPQSRPRPSPPGTARAGSPLAPTARASTSPTTTPSSFQDDRDTGLGGGTDGDLAEVCFGDVIEQLGVSP